MPRERKQVKAFDPAVDGANDTARKQLAGVQKGTQPKPKKKDATATKRKRSIDSERGPAPKKATASTASVSKKETVSKTTCEKVHAVRWTVNVQVTEFHHEEGRSFLVNTFGERVYTDCWGRECDMSCARAEETAREEHEVHEEDWQPHVYASKQSALKAARKKFCKLCDTHWRPEGDHMDPASWIEEDSPQSDPETYLEDDTFTWEGEYEHADGHQMSGMVQVWVKSMKVRP